MTKEAEAEEWDWVMAQKVEEVVLAEAWALAAVELALVAGAAEGVVEAEEVAVPRLRYTQRPPSLPVPRRQRQTLNMWTRYKLVLFRRK